ncbi:MAG: hypothetical protein IJ615_05455 [Bacteroidaceae bacterium]|nr:hypothetical protein [Bacteroidaceae bacterium]
MNKSKIMFALLLGLVLGACSSSDDDNNIDNSTNVAYTETSQSEAPVWQVDWTNNQERPDWTDPDVSAYEGWTIMKARIEEALLPFISKDDMMALFVNGELRGLAKPAVTLSGELTGSFLMKIYGNETEMETVNMTLQYYNHTLKHIFTLSDRITLDSDVTIGIDEDYVPVFTSGSAKYPAQKTVIVEPLLAKAGLTPVSGNRVGAFVGDECRGTALLSASGNTSLVIFGRIAGESVTLKYYDAATGKLYTIPDVVKM